MDFPKKLFTRENKKVKRIHRSNSSASARVHFIKGSWKHLLNTMFPVCKEQTSWCACTLLSQVVCNVLKFSIIFILRINYIVTFTMENYGHLHICYHHPIGTHSYKSASPSSPSSIARSLFCSSISLPSPNAGAVSSSIHLIEVW